MSTPITPADPTYHLIPLASRPTVLIIDADRRVRASLSALLELEEEVTVVGTAGDPAAAVSLATQHEPDVIVLDPLLPDVDAGVALLGFLRQRLPDARIVVCACSDLAESEASFSAANAVLVKGVDAGEFVASVLGRDWRLLDVSDVGPASVASGPFVRLPAAGTPR